MTIRSIDMQVLIQKVGDVAKIQQVQQEENLLKGNEANGQIAQQTAKNSRTVSQVLRKESGLVHQKEENDRRKNRNKRGKDEKKENMKDIGNNHPKGSNRGQQLDITI